MAYWQDLRDRVLRALERGDNPKDVAYRFEVGLSFVYKVGSEAQKTGVRSTLPARSHRRLCLAEFEPEMRRWLAEKPSLTVPELQLRLSEKGLLVDKDILWHQLNILNLTFKRNPERRRAAVQERWAASGDVIASSEGASHRISSAVCISSKS